MPDISPEMLYWAVFAPQAVAYAWATIRQPAVVRILFVFSGAAYVVHHMLVAYGMPGNREVMAVIAAFLTLIFVALLHCVSKARVVVFAFVVNSSLYILLPDWHDVPYVPALIVAASVACLLAAIYTKTALFVEFVFVTLASSFVVCTGAKALYEGAWNEPNGLDVSDLASWVYAVCFTLALVRLAATYVVEKLGVDTSGFERLDDDDDL